MMRITVCLGFLALLSAGTMANELRVVPAAETPPDPGFSLTATQDIGRIVLDHSERIWLLTGDNPVAAPLTEAGAGNRRPALSADGRRLAYETLRAGYRQIEIHALDSGMTRQVTFGPYDHFSPTWSADGKRIIMASNRGGTLDLWSLDIDSLLLDQLTFAPTDEFDPAWTHDGRLAWIASGAQNSAVRLESPDQNPRTLFRSRQQLSGLAFRPGGGVLTLTERAGGQSRLLMVLLTAPVTVKPMAADEQVSPGPILWLDETEFLYAAEGQIRRKSIGLKPFTQIPFFLTAP